MKSNSFLPFQYKLYKLHKFNRSSLSKNLKKTDYLLVLLNMHIHYVVFEPILKVKKK